MDRFRFNEQSSGIIEGDIVDEQDLPVTADRLTEATLTLYDLETGSLTTSPIAGVINSRLEQDAKDANDVALDAGSPATDGHFVWSVQPEDNIIVTPRRQVERHRAVFRFVWATGQFPYECEIEVVNLRMLA